MFSRVGGNPGFIESIFIRNGTPTITKHVVEHISEIVFVNSSSPKSTLRGVNPPKIEVATKLRSPENNKTSKVISKPFL